MIWGSIAVSAVLASAVTIAVVVGNHRGIQFAAPAKKAAPVALERSYIPSAAQAPVPEPAANAAVQAKDHEIARLNDALRLLAAERDRLDERVQKLEQGLGDITASINTRAAQPEPAPVQAAPRIAADAAPETPRPEQARHPLMAAAPAQPIPPAGAITAPGGEAFLGYVTARPMVEPPSAAQAPMQIHAIPRASAAGAIQSTATRTEFALDLGTEPNMEALRARWTSLRGAHGPLLANLQPLVNLREGNQAGRVELRLIAGPLANAGDAARACASLQARGVPCATVVYDGQRLAQR